MSTEYREKSAKTTEKDPSIKIERFLQLSSDLIYQELEKDIAYFDFLKQNTSSEVIRKLTEVIKFSDDSGGKKNREIYNTLRNIKGAIYEKIESGYTPDFFKEFSEQQRETIVGEMGAIELTKGCSVGCPFCGVEAEKGVKGAIPFKNLAYLANHFSTFFKQRGQFYLYWASDPLDYEDGDKNYLDVVELFKFYDLKLFTSTTYPKGKKELFREIMKKGYVDRISVSKYNLKRLKEEGWLHEDQDGYISSEYEAIREDLDTKYVGEDKEKRVRVGVVKKKDVLAGRAYAEEGNKQIGGIGCEMGVLLRTDGFYNGIVCRPTKERRTGIVLQKISVANILKPISKDDLPKTVDKLIKFGIVENRENTFLEEKGGSFVIFNFHDGRKLRYYVEYDLDDLTIKDFEEVEDAEDLELTAFIEIKKVIQYEEEGDSPDNVSKIFRTIPFYINMRDLNKKSLFYKKIIYATKELLEDFLTAPKWDVEGLAYILQYGGIEVGHAKEEINEVTQCFKNAFVLARDALQSLVAEDIDEIEERFMNQLYDVLMKRLIVSKRRKNDKDEIAAYLGKKFNKI